MSEPDRLTAEEIAARADATQPDVLRNAARAFDAAAAQFGTVRGRMNGVILDTGQLWDSYAGRRFDSYSKQLLSGLSEVGYTLGFLGRQLRAHADATETAQGALRRLRTPGPEPYRISDAIKQQELFRITHEFHESEKRVRTALWNRGEQAPGSLPMPELPPPPEQSWWERLLGPPPPVPGWIIKDGKPYGYDEDGNLVPAHRATQPVEIEFLEGGIPLGGILRWITRSGRTVRTGDEAVDEVVANVRSSPAWRPSHIEPKVREFYKLGPNDPIEPWMWDDFLFRIGRAGSKAQKVFPWSAGADRTYAILYWDPDQKAWLCVQFFRDGPNAGKFASVYSPSAEKVAEMMKKAAFP